MQITSVQKTVRFLLTGASVLVLTSGAAQAFDAVAYVKDQEGPVQNLPDTGLTTSGLSVTGTTSSATSGFDEALRNVADGRQDTTVAQTLINLYTKGNSNSQFHNANNKWVPVHDLTDYKLKEHLARLHTYKYGGTDADQPGGIPWTAAQQVEKIGIIYGLEAAQKAAKGFAELGFTPDTTYSQMIAIRPEVVVDGVNYSRAIDFEAPYVQQYKNTLTLGDQVQQAFADQITATTRNQMFDLIGAQTGMTLKQLANLSTSELDKLSKQVLGLGSEDFKASVAKNLSSQLGFDVTDMGKYTTYQQFKDLGFHSLDPYINQLAQSGYLNNAPTAMTMLSFLQGEDNLFNPGTSGPNYGTGIAALTDFINGDLASALGIDGYDSLNWGGNGNYEGRESTVGAHTSYGLFGNQRGYIYAEVQTINEFMTKGGTSLSSYARGSGSSSSSGGTCSGSGIAALVAHSGGGGSGSSSSGSCGGGGATTAAAGSGSSSGSPSAGTGSTANNSSPAANFVIGPYVDPNYGTTSYATGNNSTGGLIVTNYTMDENGNSVLADAYGNAMSAAEAAAHMAQVNAITAAQKNPGISSQELAHPGVQGVDWVWTGNGNDVAYEKKWLTDPGQFYAQPEPVSPGGFVVGPVEYGQPGGRGYEY